MHNTSGTLVSETIIEKKKRFPAHTHTHVQPWKWSWAGKKEIAEGKLQKG